MVVGYGSYLMMVEHMGIIIRNTGVRPVVSLKPTVKVNNVNILGAWNIEI